MTTPRRVVGHKFESKAIEKLADAHFAIQDLMIALRGTPLADSERVKTWAQVSQDLLAETEMKLREPGTRH